MLAGSNGEGPHLTHSERITLIQTARSALDGAGLQSVPIIAGTGTGSTRETIELTQEAAEAGADYAIVILSGYFAGVLASHKRAQKAYWKEVSEKSPIPILMYNCVCFTGHDSAYVLMIQCLDPGKQHSRRWKHPISQH